PALAPSLQPRPVPTARALPSGLAAQGDQNWTPIEGQNWTPIDTPLWQRRSSRALTAKWRLRRLLWRKNRLAKINAKRCAARAGVPAISPREDGHDWAPRNGCSHAFRNARPVARSPAASRWAGARRGRVEFLHAPVGAELRHLARRKTVHR